MSLSKHKRNFNFKNLSKAIPSEYNEDYHNLLVEWVNMEFPEKKTICGLIPLPMWLWAPKILAHAARLGMFENIAVYLRILAASNAAPQDREANLAEFSQALVDNYQNMLINYGVIGALIFSIVFGLAADNIDTAGASEEFFGSIGSYVLKHIFYFLIYACIVVSLCILFQSMIQYKQLMFWMPDMPSKMKWINKFSLLQLVFLGQIIQLLVVSAIPFGAAVAISPLAGLFGVIAVLLFAGFVGMNLLREDLCVTLLWQEAKRIVEGADTADIEQQKEQQKEQQ